MPDLNKDQLKVFLIEHFKKEPETQIESIIQSGVEEKLKRKITDKESQMLLEMINEFIVSNIIMTALNRNNTGWPWMALTEHGREVINKSGPPVYDYNGYMDEMLKRINNFDNIIKMYLSESLRAYQYNLYYSSMVMLGCSSERAILLLIKSYIDAIDNDKNKQNLLERTNGRDISVAYNRFRESFNATCKQVNSPDIIRDFDDHIEGVFNFIRLLRNSIVHPESIPNITSALVYANLQQFSYYIETIFKLIDYYSQHKITV
jgi:hypothetical protein